MDLVTLSANTVTSVQLNPTLYLRKASIPLRSTPDGSTRSPKKCLGMSPRLRRKGQKDRQFGHFGNKPGHICRPLGHLGYPNGQFPDSLRKPPSGFIKSFVVSSPTALMKRSEPRVNIPKQIAGLPVPPGSLGRPGCQKYNKLGQKSRKLGHSSVVVRK